jgi:hypothetical protein
VLPSNFLRSERRCNPAIDVFYVDELIAQGLGFALHRHGKQNHHCKVCRRQFVADATDRSISREQRTLVERLLCERLSLRGICLAVGVSLTWLLHFMGECFAACPDHLHIQPPTRPIDVVLRRLEAEADELWSFVVRRIGLVRERG